VAAVSSLFAPATDPNPTSWFGVLSRRRKRTERPSGPKPVAKAKPSPIEAKAAHVRRRIPRTSAVIIDRTTGEGVTLTSVMKRVTSKVDLDAR